MRTIPLVLAAATPKAYPLFGRYFRLVETTSPVDVNLMRRGAVVYEAVGVEAGFWSIPDGGFDEIAVVSAAPQTIKIGATQGNAGYDRSAGSVQITSGILNIRDTNGNSLDSLAKLAAFAGSRRLVVAEGGYAPGVIFQSTANLVANTPENIVAALSNTGGIVLHDAMFAGGTAGTTNLFSFLAKATAPANVADGSVLAVGVISSVSAMISPQSISQKRIAAGLRLDRINGVLTSFNVAGAHYTLLP